MKGTFAINFFRWGRRHLEAGIFLGLTLFLIPPLVIRAATVAWDPQKGRAFWDRWRQFLIHGLDDLRRACWPDIRHERMADIWFHVALIEWFAVLNATAKPAGPDGGRERILIVKLAHFGDALHIFPMLRELRRQRPDAQIDLLVGPWCEGLARAYGIHDELLLQTPRLGLFERGAKSGRRSLWCEFQWLLELRRRQYELVISTSTTTLSEVLLMQAVKARRWVGTNLPFIYGPEGTAVLVPYDSRMYEADRVMGLLSLVEMQPGDSRMFYPRSSAATTDAESMLRECGIALGEKFAVLCPGAGWPGKQWLPDRFAKIGDRIRCQLGYSIVLMGSAGEKTLCEDVAHKMREPVANLAGKTSLDQLAAVLAKAALFVGNDSGPMHLAACFQIPSVVFFGPTIASKWAPRYSSARCIQHEDCAGCISWHYRAVCLHGNRCMKAISVEEAWQAIESVRSGPEDRKDAGQ